MNAILILAAANEGFATEWPSGGVLILQLALILFLVFLNGFFVASEFAIVKVRGSQLDALIDAGNKKADFARHVTEHLDAYLSATQLGITLASLGLGWMGEPFVAQLVGPLFYKMGIVNEALTHWASVIIGFSIITFLHIVLGELTPKSLAIRKAVATTLYVSRPLALFHTLFKPAIYFLNGTANGILKHVLKIDPVGETELAHSEEELRLILAESQGADQVSSLGKEILINALDLKRRVAREIMTPRGDIIFLNTEDTFDENFDLAQRSRHTRFPLSDGHIDNTIGQVHVKDLLNIARQPNPDLSKIKRELVIVPEMMPLEKLLTFFLARHAHLALVVDEYGGAVGMVTLDNVLEEIVGDIQDEFDAEIPEYQQISEDEFTIEGTLGLYELNDLTSLELENSDVSTVGGYITHLLGHLPKEGEKVMVDDFLATITKTDGRRVEQIHFKRTAPPPVKDVADEE